MRLIFYGTLRDRFGDYVDMQADSVADGIEGFSRQVDWPRELTIHAVGFDTPEKLKESADEIHLVPAMRGGGGKWGTIILGAAMIGLAFATGGASLGLNMVTGGLSLGTTALGASMIMGGAIMILQGIMGLFLKAPTMKGVDDPEASKYLPLNKNTTAINTPITMAWGRIDLAPHWLSLQSDSTNLSFGVFPAVPN